MSEDGMIAKIAPRRGEENFKVRARQLGREIVNRHSRHVHQVQGEDF